MQVVKDGTPIKSKSLKTCGAQAHHFVGEIPRGIITPLSNTPVEHYTWMLCHMKNIVLWQAVLNHPIWIVKSWQTIDESVHPQENSAACFSNEPFWKPSVTPYVVSFWVRQSLHHAYARRVFPYAKQIEETLTRRPYASEGFAYAKLVVTRPLLKMQREVFRAAQMYSDAMIRQCQRSFDWEPSSPSP